MKVQIFVLLASITIAPLYAQNLPPLVSIPQIPLSEDVLPTLDAPLVEEMKPAVVTQMVTQIQMITQTVTNTVVVTPTNTSNSSVSKKKSKEISLSEYKTAKNILYQKMRASESLFRRTGSWVDVSFMSSSVYVTSAYNRLEFLGAYVSWGRIIKGIMFGLSYQYTASGNTLALSFPSLHEGAFVFGYRIAPDKVIGLRFMFHAGVGSSFGKSATGLSFVTPLKYVLLMPELKIDIRLYKSFVFTFGIAYKGMIFLSESQRFQQALADELSFNTVRGLRYSMGLAISY